MRRSFRFLVVVLTVALVATQSASALFPLAVPGRAAAASVYTVTRADDVNDGVCDAQCTLREAITAANADPGSTIHFNVPPTYSCLGTPFTIFDNWNTAAASNGGTSPTFSTEIPACLTRIDTYHWNNGTGATPGQISIATPTGTPVGTWDAVGSTGSGVPNANWTATVGTTAPTVLNGRYTCVDSQPATWSQNDSSGGLGFCRVTGIAALSSFVITPTRALPAITSPMLIDGASQPGYAGAPLVLIDGSSAGATSGLVLSGGTASIEGLAIGGFAFYGVDLRSSGNFLGSNWIGLRPNGTALGNGRSTGNGQIYGGVRVNSGDNNSVGNSDQGNVVSSNSGQGIEVDAAAVGTHVARNTVGTDASTELARGNTVNGIFVAANGTIVANNISSHNLHGLSFGASGMTVSGNELSGNLQNGVLGSGSDNTFSNNSLEGNAGSGFFLGYPGATTRNNQFVDDAVRNNGGDGYLFRGPLGVGNETEITDANTIVRGSIAGNAGKGVSLAFGSNGGIQAPVITDVQNGDGFFVSGTAAPNALVQVYADAADEGETFLGSMNASDGDGSWRLGGSAHPWSYEGISSIASQVIAGALAVHATQTTSLGTSELSLAIAAITGIATCNNDTLLYGANVDLYSGSALVKSTFASTQTALYRFTGVAPSAKYRIHIFVPTDGPGQAASCWVTTTTDGSGSSSVSTGVSILNRGNHVWPKAFDVSTGAGVTVLGQRDWQLADYVFQQGQSTWFKVPVRPGQRVLVKATNVPADYSVALYKDIQKLFDQQSAALAGGDLAAKLKAIANLDASVAPDALSPDELSPDALSPDELSPDALSPDALSPDALSPDALSPDELSPDELSPDALSPDALSPDALSPDALSPDALSSVYAGAQTAALIGVSAHVGLSPEQIARNTWDNSGYFYVRVRGHNGVYDASLPFTLEVKVTDVACTGVTLTDTPLSGFAPLATGRKTIILTDTAQFPAGTDTAALMTALNTFAGRPDIAGAVVDLKDVAGVASAYAIWNGAQDCPAAANIVARRIKDVIEAYRSARNPDLSLRSPAFKYVVLAGNDHVVPFFRIPDQSGLGSEKDYRPAVQDPTASQASLRFGYVLTQDFYGANAPISRFDHELYVPDLAVGRLVETVSDMTAVINAYVATNGVVAPTQALVTGYDFLADTAGFVADQLGAGGAGMTTDRQLIQPVGESPNGPNVWTAPQLRSKLFGPTPYGILSLNSHFSGNSMLAADYATRILSNEISALPAADLRFRNALILSTGCHSGYNIVNGEATALTQPTDWAQAFASRGATLIGGTGYQYGDTDFMKYSEQILANTTLELRYGTGAVPIGVALANAKRIYLNGLVSFKGIDEKAMAEATLYGLPMLGYDLPGTPLPRPGTGGALNSTPITSDLSYADVSPSYTLHPNTRTLTVAGGASLPATYYDIAGNIAVSPATPVLPETQNDVAIAGQAVRGAVLMSADYTDVSPMTPFTDVATTEVRGAHPGYVTNVFTPVRPFDLNQFSGSNLLTTPFQYKSITSTTGIGRLINAESYRLYYSTLTDARALAAAPVVYNVLLLPSADPAKVDVVVSLGAQGAAGLTPSVGVQEVWVTFTGEADGLKGHWASQKLTLSTSTWSAGTSYVAFGSIARGTTAVNDVRALVQAVGGNGLVTFASNDGEYYKVVTETATPAHPKITTALSLTVPSTGQYLSSVPVRARLTSGGAGVNGKRVSFRSGGVRVDATTGTDLATGQDGWASGQLRLDSIPGPAGVNVGFAEEDGYLGSGADATIAVTKAATSFVAADQTVLVGGSIVLATLMGAGQPLGGQLVMISANGKTVQTFTDGYGRVRLDATDGFPSGAYAVAIAYAGNDRYGPASGTANIVVFDPNGFAAGIGSIVAGTDAVGFTPGKRVGFAFAAVYRRGATKPIGLFEVLSLESRLLFSATSFDWLTVAGKRAEMQGHGNVNGRSGWSFRAVAVDGTPDRIEIRIWQDGTSASYALPNYRVTGTVARGILVRLLDPSERDFSPLQLRGLAERE